MPQSDTKPRPVFGGNAPALILCERSRRWATALANYLPPELRVRETRWLGECTQALAEAPTSLVAVELTRANLADIVQMAQRIDGEHPHARLIVLAQVELAGYETVVREAGAIHFVGSSRELDSVARILTGHLARLPRGKTNFATQVWNTLPWSDDPLARP